ncbi:hypothetical protein NP493_103g00000 [Ridgeia piscesae]|uniref:Uncharacterized protein n=1 Tax=Ridgeia piscesae TaxID=27915 RepID=A0AAD9P7Q9_RIDPI|nr:hypothetical protein NP493_103g00000 [Ridgeia piscesae]
MNGLPSNATNNNYDYVTHRGVRNGSPPGGPLAMTCRTCTTPDYDYIDIDTLDVPPTQTQDTELDNDSMDGPYNTIKAPAVPERRLSEKGATDDVLMVDNDNYEGVGEMASGMKNQRKSGDFLMVDNAGYEAVGQEQRGDKDRGQSDDLVMVDNAGYEAVGPEMQGNGATGNSNDIVFVDNADYEAIGGN